MVYFGVYSEAALNEYARCENLIPEMVAASRWGVESGKIMYPNTFGHVPTYV
jgi:hypothetical protein